MYANPAAPLTTGQAAEVLGVSVHTAKKWAARGWLDPTGERRHLTEVDRDARGNRRFRLRDWLDAEMHTRHSPQSRRHAMA